MNILFVDNYDSFAYTIAAFLQCKGNVQVVKSDTPMTLIHNTEKDLIVLGPGPNGPEESGNYLEILNTYKERSKIFGICLGFQTIVHYFGGQIHPVKEAAHGIASAVSHNDKNMFRGLKNPLLCARYHSLGCYKNEVPDCLDITASIDDLVMAVNHKTLNVAGVQFHPESVLSEGGIELLRSL